MTSSPITLHNNLSATLALVRKNWIEIAEDLYNLKLGENFKQAVGNGIDTWMSYISQPEIDLSKGEADRLVRAYSELVIERGLSKESLSNMPFKSLLSLIGVLPDIENVEELIDSASNLSHRDFKELLHDTIKEDSGVRTYTYSIMRRCVETGNMNKVRDIPSDLIKETFKIND